MECNVKATGANYEQKETGYQSALRAVKLAFYGSEETQLKASDLEGPLAASHSELVDELSFSAGGPTRRAWPAVWTACTS